MSLERAYVRTIGPLITHSHTKFPTKHVNWHRSKVNSYACAIYLTRLGQS